MQCFRLPGTMTQQRRSIIDISQATVPLTHINLKLCIRTLITCNHEFDSWPSLYPNQLACCQCLLWLMPSLLFLAGPRVSVGTELGNSPGHSQDSGDDLLVTFASSVYGSFGPENKNVGHIFKCDHCNRYFSSSYSRNSHKKAVHEGVTHACICGKKYRYRRGLMRHQKECQVVRSLENTSN